MIEALPQDCLDLKAQLDDYMAARDSYYFKDAYGRCRWVRRVALFVISGCYDNKHYKMLHWLLEEWTRHRESIVIQ